MFALSCLTAITTYMGVHQTAQTSKTAPKPPAKWHNRTAPHRMMQCSLRFYNKKTAQTAPSLYINIFNYF